MRDLRIGEEIFVEFGQVRQLYDIYYFYLHVIDEEFGSERCNILSKVTQPVRCKTSK